jgi:hypothetical protein
MASHRNSIRSRKEALHRQREKALIARIALLSVLSIGVIYILIVYGIPAMVGIADAWLQIRDSEKGTKFEKQTILSAPSLPPPENDFTNKEVFSVSGTSESGSKVVLIVNDRVFGEVITTRDGVFSFNNVPLQEGKNVYFVYRTDELGNKSADSAKRDIVLDTQAPNIEVKTPFTGQSFKGQGQRVVEVTGTTTGADSVLVNENFVILSEDGSFSYRYPLSPGENAIKIKAKDNAGNESVEVTRTVRWEE